MDANKINSRLYWTNYNIGALYAECVDPETGEVSEDFPGRLAALLERADENKDDALNEIKTRLAMIDARKGEIARIREDIAKDEKVIEQIKNALSGVLGGNPYKSAVGSVSYRRSKAVEIDNPEALTRWAQENALDIFTHPAPVISKTAVGDLLKDGVDVPHAAIVERLNAVIR